MPMGGMPPVPASRARRIAAVALLFLLLCGELADGGGSAAASFNKLALLSLVCTRDLASLLAGEATKEVHDELRRRGFLRFADRAEAYLLWCDAWSNAARSCGRWAVSVGGRLMERPRPQKQSMGGLRRLTMEFSDRMAVILPPGLAPKGRQLSFFPESTVSSGGDLAVPSGLVPGGSEVQSGEKLSGTRLRFFILVGGPFCNSQGLVCDLQFLLDPDVIRSVLLFPTE